MSVTIEQASVKVTVKGFEGDTIPIICNWTADAVQVDLTGYTAKMQVKHKKTDTTALLTLTDTAGIVLGGVDNNIVAELSDAQSAELGEGQFVFDIQLTNASGKSRTLIYGTIVLQLSVTQP